MQSLAAIGTRLTGTVLSTVWQDVKYGARLMRRRPAFSLTVVLVLTLGIGANTALFRVVNALFFTPLPVPAPNELFYVYQRSPDGRLSAPSMDKDELDLLRAQTGTLAGYAAHARMLAVLSTDLDTEQDTGEAVSANYFALLGVGTAIGRPLGPGDDDPAVPPVVVISHALWVRRFQADPGVVGRQVRINDQHATIVGVTSVASRIRWRQQPSG